MPLTDNSNGHLRQSIIPTHGAFPLYRAGVAHTTHFYDRTDLEIGIPLASTAAKLTFFSHRQVTPIGIPIHLPLTHQHAIQIGSTQEDVHELNQHKVFKHAPLTTWEHNSATPPPSSHFDDDWYRLMDCIYPMEKSSLIPQVSLKASRSIFRKLLTGVVCATMRWHDVTPAGRMLNRFGKDIETIDTNLASSLSAVNSSLATFAAAIITVVIFFPIFLIPVVVIGFFYRMLALGYLKTGRDLRRMESNSRLPIFSGFGELLEGIVTVRAFSAERRFLDDLHDKIDVTTKMWYNLWMTNRWLLLNFDGLGGLAVLATTLLALSSYVSAGTAGLCITSAMAFTTSVYWACRFWTALELDLNSVERVVEYLDLPQEPPAIIESSRHPAYWPSSSTKEGLLTVEDLVIKYAPELPPVLHNVSFTLNAKERIGLLGRTGSGKLLAGSKAAHCDGARAVHSFNGDSHRKTVILFDNHAQPG